MGRNSKRPYWLVEVRFWDHARYTRGGGKVLSIEPIFCQTWGILVSSRGKSLKVMTWLCDRDKKDLTNNEFTVILKSDLAEPPIKIRRVYL